MYKVEIKTKYNIIHLEIDDISEIAELLGQPYIIEVRMEKIKEKTLKRETKK